MGISEAEKESTKFGNEVNALQRVLIPAQEKLVAHLRQQLESAEAELACDRKTLAKTMEAALDAADRWGKTQAAPMHNLALLREKLRTAEMANGAVRLRRKREAMEKERQAAAAQGVLADEEIKKLDAEKREAAATADFGVKDFRIDPDKEELIYRGRPIEKASQGERFKFFVEFRTKQNPRIGTIFSRWASVLDYDTLKECEEVASTRGLQLIFEIVHTCPGALKLLATEDGTIIEGTERPPDAVFKELMEKDEPLADTTPDAK
jgi:hypothetical protein